MNLLSVAQFRPVLPLRILIVIALSAFCGCRRPQQGQTAVSAAPESQWFEDITDKSGLHFVHDCGPFNPRFMPQVVGSGGAFFDYDNDGRLDVYLIQNGGPNGRKNQLFHQEADGTFKDVSAGSGLDVAGFGMGVAIGDVNNDGLPDVLLTEYGRVRLFLNNGNGAFSDVTREAGLEDVHWATSAAFIDYDRDGWLDLVICNYLLFTPSQLCTDEAGRPDYCGPTAFPGTVATLYHNMGPHWERRGDTETRRRGEITSPSPRVPASTLSISASPALPAVPHFQDVTVQSGLARAEGAGLGVVCLDFDGDGWPDIFITNDERPNFLWINQRDGTFKEEALLRGLAFSGMGHPQANMGIAIGDISAHGLLDVFVTHLTEETDVLWSQGPAGEFQDRTAAAGLTSSTWRGTGFGTVLADFDNDGALDLGIVNGRVRRARFSDRDNHSAAAATDYWAAYAERNQLYAGNGAGAFRDISPQNKDFCGTPALGRALLCGDLGNRGAVDLLATKVGGPARLYRNVASQSGHWLGVRTIEPAHGGREACGAVITVETGGRKSIGWASSAGSYLTSNDPRAHFGLGPADHVDAIRVVWPDGRGEVFPGTSANQFITLQEGTGAKTD